MPFEAPSLPSTLNVLSAMITPAVLILATSSLILTTTNRLVRVVDRVRAMLPEFERQADSESDDPRSLERRQMLFGQLDRATVRARLIQKAITRLYTALSAFLATSAALGITAFTHIEAAWLPLSLGVIGVALLFSASILLILESRIALASTYAEMDYIRRISRSAAPEGHRGPRRWWRLIG
ncbi:MAG TPA: DUF2721 domain-containing protein [Thermoanaerobaculia bacterium]|nr:DUF2721 domain-containing protein [Thermoanaerobaculia bacterium]